MADCLFCKMVRGEIKPKVEYEDSEILAFHDINPQAPVHVLVIPKRHIEKVEALEAGDIGLAGKLLYQAKQIAVQRGWQDYRIVFNNGAEAGQSVFHIHLHLLGGRQMNWPPG